MTEPTSAQDLIKGRHFDQEIIMVCVWTGNLLVGPKGGRCTRGYMSSETEDSMSARFWVPDPLAVFGVHQSTRSIKLSAFLPHARKPDIARASLALSVSPSA